MIRKLDDIASELREVKTMLARSEEEAARVAAQAEQVANYIRKEHMRREALEEELHLAALGKDREGGHKWQENESVLAIAAARNWVNSVLAVMKPLDNKCPSCSETLAFSAAPFPGGVDVTVCCGTHGSGVRHLTLGPGGKQPDQMAWVNELGKPWELSISPAERAAQQQAGSRGRSS